MKSSKNKKTTFSIIGYFIFLLTNCTLVSFAFVVYHMITRSTTDYAIIAIVILLYIILSALIATIIDYFRRKIMIEKPLIKILNATDEIIEGNYNIDLKVTHTLNKYDAFDLISDNINQLALELRNVEMMHNDFISNVSHEIKTPLAIIQNYAKALTNDNLNEESKTKCIKTIIQASYKLTNLVNNMLKLNKLENQGIMPSRKEVNLYNSLSESILSFEEIIEKKNLELICHLEEIYIYSIPEYLSIIWNNLLSNAIKFTNEKGTITIWLYKEDNKAVMKISDTGCGIPKEVGNHIFDKFYQGDTSHTSEGNGLGLSLVKKIIDLIGGEILVQSQVDKGSTFVVKLTNQNH